MAKPIDRETLVENTFADFLRMFVPLEIMSLEERGGPSDVDWQWVRSEGESGLEKFDIVFRGSDTRGEVATIVGTVVRCVAILAFAPGGIEVCGHHFVAYETVKETPNYE